MITRLWYGCWLSHGNQLTTRDESGNLILKCQDCGSETRLLETPMYRNGPQHQPVEVKGTPKTRVYPTDKVEEFKPKVVVSGRFQ